MDLNDLTNETYKRRRAGEPRRPLGAAVVNPRDAYRDVPILKKPVWNHEVAAYFYLGGISAGSAVIGSLAEAFGGHRHERLARTAHYISFLTFLPCPPLLIDDLGMPSRFLHMLRVFKPSSPMNLGAWAFAVHGAGATVTVLRMLAAEGRLPFIDRPIRLFPERLLASLGIPSSLTLAGYTGVLLGTTSIPVWNSSPVLGGLFTASAFSTGAAAVNLVASATKREDEEERKALAVMTLVSGAVELALMGLYIATLGKAGKPLKEGEPGALMAAAGGAMLAATNLEAFSQVLPRLRRPLTTLGSVAALASGALLRWAVVRAGRASAADREGTLHAMRPRKQVSGWHP